MSRFVVAHELKPGDILSEGDGRYAVLAQVIYQTRDKSVESVAVFPLLPPDNVPSYAEPLSLDSTCIAAGRIPTGGPWAISVTASPRLISISEDRYGATVVGRLAEEKIDEMNNTFIAQGGRKTAYAHEDNGRWARVNPDQLQGATILERGLDRLENEGGAGKPRRPGKPKPHDFEGRLLDISLDNAQKIFNLPRELVDRLLNPRNPDLSPLTHLRQAQSLSIPELAVYIGSDQTGMPQITASSNMSLDAAQDAGILDRIDRLNLIQNPYPASGTKMTPPAIKTLSDLFALANGTSTTGMDAYLGLASPQSKARLALIEAARTAQKRLNEMSTPQNSPALMPKEALTGLKSAWSQFTTDYLTITDNKPGAETLASKYRSQEGAPVYELRQQPKAP